MICTLSIYIINMPFRNTEGGNLICVERCLSINCKTLTQRKHIISMNWTCKLWQRRLRISSLPEHPGTDRVVRGHYESMIYRTFVILWTLVTLGKLIQELSNTSEGPGPYVWWQHRHGTFHLTLTSYNGTTQNRITNFQASFVSSGLLSKYLIFIFLF